MAKQEKEVTRKLARAKFLGQMITTWNEGSERVTSVASISCRFCTVVTATLAFLQYWSVMLGSISGHREVAASTRAPFGLLQLRLDSVPSFTASFHPFSNVPLTFQDGLKAARKRRLSRPTYSLPLSLFLSASVAHSSLECSSLRERT